MKSNTETKCYSKFSFEDFLQDDYFISSMKNPTPESSKFWNQFLKEEKNTNFEAAKLWIESYNRYHYSLSPKEISDIMQGIHKKKNRRKTVRRLYYWSVAAAASIALILFLKYLPTDNKDSISVKQDITTFADISRPEVKGTETQLILSQEQTILLSQKETSITYDSTGIVVDNHVVTKDEITGFNQLIVPLGKKSILNLSDGTKIWVNSDSRLIYPVAFEKDSREIYIDGEMYIEVAEETNRTFTVRTKDMSVQVMGTKFNITAYEKDNEKGIVLVSGLVNIVLEKDKTITQLHPNQMYYYEKGESHIEQVNIQKHISWIEGYYYCEKESLGNILQRLSRHYGIEIVCDPSVAGVIYSGKLDLKENLYDIIVGISFTLPISFSENDGKYVISRIKKKT